MDSHLGYVIVNLGCQLDGEMSREPIKHYLWVCLWEKISMWVSILKGKTTLDWKGRYCLMSWSPEWGRKRKGGRGKTLALPSKVGCFLSHCCPWTSECWFISLGNLGLNTSDLLGSQAFGLCSEAFRLELGLTTNILWFSACSWPSRNFSALCDCESV